MSNPLLPPKSAVAFFLGGAGGVFGITSSVSIILNPVRGDQIGFSGLDIGAEIFNLSVYFTLPAALDAIFGALLTLRWLKAGGVILVMASMIGMLVSIAPVALAYSTPFTCCPARGVGHPEYIFFLGELTVWWWVPMILSAGITALVRYHEFRKRIANSQTRVNPVQVPSSSEPRDQTETIAPNPNHLLEFQKPNIRLWAQKPFKTAYFHSESDLSLVKTEHEGEGGYTTQKEKFERGRNNSHPGFVPASNSPEQ